MVQEDETVFNKIFTQFQPDPEVEQELEHEPGPEPGTSERFRSPRLFSPSTKA